MSKAIEQATRRKPWYRLRNILLMFALVFVVFIGWFVLEYIRLANAEPTIAVDYREQFDQLSAELAGVSQEDAYASWAVLMEAGEIAFAIVQEINEETKAGFDEFDNYTPRWPDDEYYLDLSWMLDGQPMREGLDRERKAVRMMYERGAFDKLREFTSMGVGLDPVRPNETIWNETASNRGGIHDALSGRLASARLAFVESDFNEVADAFEDCLAIAETLVYQRRSFALGAARSRLMRTTVEMQLELHEGGFDEPTARRLIVALHDLKFPSFSLSIEAKRFTSLDMVQWYYTDNGKGDGYLIPQSGVLPGNMADGPTISWHAPLWCRFIAPDRAEEMASLDECFDSVNKTTTMPVAEGVAYLTELELRWANERNAGLAVPLVSGMSQFGNWAHQLSWDAGARTDLSATILLLAINVYEQQHGELPSSLNALVPGVLDTLPVDSINGQTFGYTLLESPDDSGRRFLLYTFGMDGEDNDAREIDESMGHPMNAMLELHSVGYDYILNRPRPTWTGE